MDNLKDRIMSDLNSKPIEKSISPIETAKTVKRTHTAGLGSEIFKPIVNKAITDLVVNGLALISDLIIGAVDIKIYGENRHKHLGRSGYTNYNTVSRWADTFNGRRVNSVLDATPTTKKTYGFNMREIVLPDRGAAENVIMKCDELIATYGSITVGDLYQLVGLPTESIDYKYGWKTVDGFSTRRVFEGHLLVVPEPKTL